MNKAKKDGGILKQILLTRVRLGRKLVITYSLIFAVLIGISIFLALQIDSLSAFYAVHSTYINESGACSPSNKSTMMLFYGSFSSCPSCSAEYEAFMNETAFFGIWQNDTPGPRFYGPFCAYAVNMTLYDQNQSAVFAPIDAISIFQQFSQNDVPFIVFGGEYSKIGGFSNQTVAEEQIFKYICLAINNSAVQCK